MKSILFFEKPNEIHKPSKEKDKNYTRLRKKEREDKKKERRRNRRNKNNYRRKLCAFLGNNLET